MSDILPPSPPAPGADAIPREATAPGGSPPPDDAGAQALSEALRSSFAIVKVIMIGLVVLFLSSGFFTVGSQDRAVKLRFGVPVGGGDGKLLGPGFHWAFPPPIDEVIKIPVEQVQSVNSSVGWYATTPGGEPAEPEPDASQPLHPVRDGYLITGDVNIIHASATLRYRIAEPGLRYMLDFVNSSNLIQNALNNALLQAAARYRVDDALTRDQAGFRELALEHLSRFVRDHDLGITDLHLDNLRMIPPRQLKDFITAVSGADSVRSKQVNESKSYANQTLSRARAEARRRNDDAQAQRTRFVESAAAEVERFTNNLPAYRANPKLFSEQRRAATLAIVFTNAVEKTLLPEHGSSSNRTLWLQINREAPKAVLRSVEPPKDTH